MIRKSRDFLTDDEIRDVIGRNVAALLVVRGLSRRDVAKKTGDPVATVARVASGRHIAQAGVIIRIAAALGVTVDRLLTPPR